MDYLKLLRRTVLLGLFLFCFFLCWWFRLTLLVCLVDCVLFWLVRFADKSLFVYVMNCYFVYSLCSVSVDWLDCCCLCVCVLDLLRCFSWLIWLFVWICLRLCGFVIVLWLLCFCYCAGYLFCYDCFSGIASG